MPGESESESRRTLLTKLVPYLALSAIKVGVAASPVSVLASAAAKYNEAGEKTREKVNDLLPLLPGVEKLKIQIAGPDAVSFVLQRDDIRTYAEQYLRQFFALEGANGAPGGPPPAAGGLAEFDYVLRLPSRSVYIKVVETLTKEDASRVLGIAKRMNPAEVWVFEDQGEAVDLKLDPVFISENVVQRGRMRTVTAAEMLQELFGRNFYVTVGARTRESLEIVLRLA